MTAKLENISFSLQETCSDKNDENIISYEDLVKEVDLMEMTSIIGMDDYIAMEVDYQTNYLKKDLDRIADYYEISKRKKRKEQLVEDIVLFEKDPENIEIVFQRKKLWSYVEEIKSDKYLSKFLILD
jgi:vacuolar-type H+-ATPase subunit C/Vma6